MKSIIRQAVKEENGKILILVLVLLVVGGLLLGPLLGLMSTGLASGQVYEKKAAELYAADAGVEDALWQIKHDPDSAKVPGTPEQEVGPYNLGDALNGKEVEVSVDMIRGSSGNGLYRVTSTAQLDGSDTRVETSIRSFPLLWGNAITSTGDVQLKPNSGVWGDVWGNVSGEQRVYEGDVYDPYPESDWPTAADFAYLSDGLERLAVEAGCGSTAAKLVVQSVEVPSGFHEGNLRIVNSDTNITQATLTGTVYVKAANATLELFHASDRYWELDLNGQTIYVEGGNKVGENQWALLVGSQGAIKGSGAIIAEGNIKFQPNIVAGSEEGFVFVMSILGMVYFQPGATFYGSVAGRQVDVWPDKDPAQYKDETIVYTEPPYDLIFPFDKMESRVTILTWEVK